MLLTCLDRYRDWGLLILRIGIGIAFLIHGLPKIMAGPEMWAGLGQNISNFGINFGYTFWGFMAAFAEAGGGIMLIFGFLFRYATLLLFINMMVALSFHISKGDDFSIYSHALEAGIVFFSLIFIGPGRFAVDSMICRRKPASATVDASPAR